MRLAIDEDNTGDTVENIIFDDGHRNPTAQSKIQQKYCRETLKLPTRPSHMTAGFRGNLSSAYLRDYGRNVHHMGTSVVEWWKKFSFDANNKRTTFGRGDFIQVRGTTLKVCGIDDIFTHEALPGYKRLFLILTPTLQPTERVDPAPTSQHTGCVNPVSTSQATGRIDPILKLPLLRIEGEEQQFFVGLPAIEATKLFILPVKEHDGHDNEIPLDKDSDTLLYVNWSKIHFM
ncbi:hypothetical protein P152DRAFT_470077 [Eremomyces bilateralis CBS 781.70]|uniref:Uncharacterized protein n=1 Tax=Eremomyces bilateralis CBS 781.70 TaxID=1392243 RepID=A0A6G1GDM1_9PEZI|nr:uncharacterized protein P152DRAFT_456338 [Eremomyces bilateralis CBS 781.70]XP_033537641.1 uncharacterized protein P152DRAFT_470077 [Eremomyces bilateralis CBS 781.70]KAF1814106.1 hypothetical protein P152DRAFT_456338 [Eremomyces bilateralis CBS 781.70]KAF1816010.1 hypothetical protein P152DRAFT_470077 [Eremomyces bilateralis CBS 781.70]